MVCLCRETYCCFDSQSDIFECKRKRLKKRTLEDSANGLMSIYCKNLDEVISLTSKIEVFAQFNKLMSHMSKQRRDCHAFIRNEIFRKTEYTLFPLICNNTQFNIRFQLLWVTNVVCYSCYLYFLNNFLNLKSILLHITISQQYPQT